LRSVSRLAASILAALFCAWPLHGVVRADSLSQDKNLLQQLQQQSQTIYQQISKEKATENVDESKLTEYRDSLENVQHAMMENAAQMQSLQTQIQALQVQIHATDVKLASYKTDLEARLRLMYEDGNVQYLEVILHATSFNDLLNRLHGLAVISQENKDLLQQVQQLQQELAQQNAQKAQAYQTLAKKHQELKTLQQTDAILAADEKATLKAAQTSVAAAEEKHGLLESQIHLTQSQIQEIQLQTEEANALMENKSYVAQTAAQMKSAPVHQLIAYAESYLGVPYVWGGTSPSGFDCSGFTQYVLAHFGIDIYRTSEEQFAEGVPVSENDLQPGDLVFFSTYAPGASHVGIYIGNGLMVDAQDMGVSIDSVFNSYWGPKYLGARQMFNP
jgi:cell wall-associated NlpC family hydrolase